MGSALLFNRIIRLGGESGLPDYTFDGNVTVLDTGEESGSWQVALTSSGTLVLNEDVQNVTIQLQGGGGGGGAGNESARGSDGTDGTSKTLTTSLAAGSYSVAIGSGGSRGSDSAGSSGGTTSFGSLASASGGSGGAYLGASTLSHSSIYGSYGQGGSGGSTSQYTETTTTVGYMWPKDSSGCNVYASNSTDSEVVGTLTGEVKMANNDVSDGVYAIKSGEYSGYYVNQFDVYYTNRTEVLYTTYYGNAGNPGIVLLSGEA